MKLISLFILSVLLGKVYTLRQTKRLSRSSSGSSLQKYIQNALLSGALAFLPYSQVPVWALDNVYTSDKGVFSFEYPDDLKISAKPVQTHALEVYLKSEQVKGFSVGLTVDPVKINNIKEFTSPSGLAEKVVNVEKAKEGVFETEVLGSKETVVPRLLSDNRDTVISTENSAMQEPLFAYDIEYKVDSSRGLNHYVVRSAVGNKKLYVFTAQCKEASYPEVKDVTRQILDSLVIGSVQ
mmetsp:Transcript_19979/g.33464  ORF Transcript_19979/g.33464 Transcript_19979/m.33464 type:complete len:238 (+) Transcript_19979:74-787(+)